MFCGLDVVVCLDQEALDAGLDVLADVAGLCEGVAVADGAGDVELLAEGPGENSRSVLWLLAKLAKLKQVVSHSRIYVLPTPVGPKSSRLLLSILTCCGTVGSSGT